MEKLNPILISLLFIVACKHTQNPSPALVGQHAMVASAHPLASQAGLDILKAGGNATDAGVAVAFAISVLRPQSSGLGGGGFWLAYDAKKKQSLTYDYRERAPLRATKNMFLNPDGTAKDFLFAGQRIPRASVNGHLAVAVPGLVYGLLKIHRESGRLPLAQVIAPAIALARNGFQVYPSLAESILLRRDVLDKFKSSAKIFIPNGKPLKEGDWLVQEDLAKTLEAIASAGAPGFYQGRVGGLLLEELKNGIIDAQDFQEYQVKVRPPIGFTYKGNKVLTMPPPSSGGVHLLQMLGMLEQSDMATHAPQSVESIHLLAESMRRAFADRAYFMGDPDFVTIPVRHLIAKDYIKSRFLTITNDRATPSSVLQQGRPPLRESSSTTHFSIVDTEGNAVSSTQTINYAFGSGVVAEGTGVVLNDEMDDFAIGQQKANVFGLTSVSDQNAIAPKKTMLSSMSPTIVFDKNNELLMVLGSPGGPRIINATLQCMVNIIDHHMPIDEAVSLPRVHHQWFPDELVVEPGTLTASQKARLEKMGHKIVSTDFPIGDVQIIMRSNEGWLGFSDPRFEGQPRGF